MQILTEPLYRDLFTAEIFFTRNTNQWRRLDECIFERLRHEDAGTRSVVVETLHSAGVRLALDVRNHILLALGAFGFAPDIVTPSVVREALHRCPDSYLRLSRPSRLCLLTYILKDGDHKEIVGLEMLPLADGKYAKVGSNEKRRPVYLPTEEFPLSLLPTLSSDVIAVDELDEQLKYRLQKLASGGMYSVAIFFMLLPSSANSNFY